VHKVIKHRNENLNVLDAAFARFEYLFMHFDNVVFSFSGGKDSSVALQLGAMVARRMKKKITILYLDLEAMFQETTRHIIEVRDAVKDITKDFYWVCLPVIEENSLSTLNPEFITWDDSAKDKWVREMPNEAINIDNNPFSFYEGLMGTEDFFEEFGKWFAKKNGLTASVIGIRTDESLRRFVAIISEGKSTFKDEKWTTELGKNLYAVYPLYDWGVNDIWGAIAKFDLYYNKVYEWMWKNGVPLSKQRICQPFGQAQRAGLDQYREIEPQTWERLLQRVEGVNFGAIYCRSSLLGSIKSMKPPHMSWQQYAVFLLESIGLYERLIMERYYRKIKYYLRWEEKNHGYEYPNVPETTDIKLHGNWKNIARGLEKNDFFLSHLSFGIDKAGDQLLVELRKKHKLIGDGSMQPKILKKITEVAGKENS
jgi:predicted phosphoadenosine phosphosulfate sulfurtransferase